MFVGKFWKAIASAFSSRVLPSESPATRSREREHSEPYLRQEASQKQNSAGDGTTNTSALSNSEVQDPHLPSTVNSRSHTISSHNDKGDDAEDIPKRSEKPPRPASASLGRSSRARKDSSKKRHMRSRSQAFRSPTRRRNSSRSERSRSGSGSGSRHRARLKRMFGYSFQFIRKLDNKVSIRARNGKFLRMDSKGRLVAVRWCFLALRISLGTCLKPWCASQKSSDTEAQVW